MSELQVDPVVGYRMFEIQGHELVGHHGERWVPGKNQAHCDQVRRGARRRKVWVNDPDDPENLIQTTVARGDGHGRIPDPACGCGFWAYWSESGCRDRMGPRHARAWGAGYGSFAPLQESYMMGRVMGWGRVLEGADGWRSEFAKVTAIIAFTSVADAAMFFGVPVLAPRTKEEEGVTEGWIDRVERSDPKVVTFVTIGEDDVDGDFLAAPSLIARPGGHVRLRFERRGTMRWITDVSELADEEEEQ
jgi:hypothetical protein